MKGEVKELHEDLIKRDLWSKSSFFLGEKTSLGNKKDFKGV